MAAQGDEQQVTCSALEKKITRQIEFYFGDKNLPRDKFLQDQIKKDEEGWVTIAVLTTFNRLKQLSSDVGVIAGALKKSANNLVEVSEDGSKVRRNPSQPVPATENKSADEKEDEESRTVYVKGFPMDTTLDQLEEFFDPFGQVLLIRMKRVAFSKFRGSVFVEFKSRGDAEKLMQAPDLKYKEADLLREWKNDYNERKEKEKKPGSVLAAESKVKQSQEEEDGKEHEAEHHKSSIPKGAVIKFQGCGPDASMIEIKEFFLEFVDVGYVEFTSGGTEGYIRFASAEVAKSAIEKVTAAAKDGKVMLCGGESKLTVLEGEEEKAYQKRADAARQKKLNSKGKGQKYGRTKHFGQKRGAKSFRNEDKEDGPPRSKQVKEE